MTTLASAELTPSEQTRREVPAPSVRAGLAAKPWWATPTPPPLAGPVLDNLAEHAEQVVFDSLGWDEPNRGVANSSTWLGKFERDPSQGPWRVASDVNWRRLKYWRRLL